MTTEAEYLGIKEIRLSGSKKSGDVKRRNLSTFLHGLGASQRVSSMSRMSCFALRINNGGILKNRLGLQMRM